MDGKNRGRCRFRQRHQRTPFVKNPSVPVARNGTQGLLVQDGSVLEYLGALGVHHGEKRCIGNRGNKNTPILTHGRGDEQSKCEAGTDSNSTMHEGIPSESNQNKSVGAPVQAHCACNRLYLSRQRTPGISLVFREMWNTTNLDISPAKNEPIPRLSPARKVVTGVKDHGT
jgi:hypothetical protein